MAGGDQDRQPGIAQGLHDEACGVAGHVIVFKEIAAAGDHVGLGFSSPLDDPLEGGPKVLAASLLPDAVQALTREGSVEMQVSEMEQAKGHKSPATPPMLPRPNPQISSQPVPYSNL